MAVYTTLAFDEVEELLKPFDLGRLVAFEPVIAGIENTTYFLQITNSESCLHTSEYVLTIAETVTTRDIQFVSSITTALRDQHIPVPAPILNRHGHSLITARGKPALLMPKMRGRHPVTPTIQQCRAIGTALAQLHTVTLRLELTHNSHRGLPWVIRTGQRLLGHLPESDRRLLKESLEDAKRLVSTQKQLPLAIIHGDLFRDNTLFVKNKLTAIIDFFSAGTGFLLFDLAVAANDWCMDIHTLNSKRLSTLLSSYDATRALTEDEKCYWSKMLEIAALRFWVSRLVSNISPAQGSPVKDPKLYRDLLITHKNSPNIWPETTKEELI